ncbi:MAG TPA: response regulator transcription factor [Candidatus Dormibacteraeota bacterium]|nr:response regulator transcription factor [Candidatus Dormibacteraeota bacterium]
MTAVPTPIVQVPRLHGDRSPILADAIAQLIASEPELASITLAEFAARPRSAGTRSAPDRLLTPVPSAAVALQDIGHLLSERELEVVRLVSEGLSNKDISHRLGLSDKTVKNHISHILAKLNLTARTQVAVLAIRGGFA